MLAKEGLELQAKKLVASKLKFSFGNIGDTVKIRVPER